jgi:hypothetical protein
MAGLDESVTMRLYQLAGIPASNTNYVQFRVVEGANEAPADQYSGDLWGLYLAVEYTGGHWLDEHGLEDGNVYKIEGSANSRNLSPDQVSDGSDWTSLLSHISTTSTPEAGGGPTSISMTFFPSRPSTAWTPISICASGITISCTTRPTGTGW